MSDRDRTDQGGDPPCWAHLLFEDAEVDDDPGDDPGDGRDSLLSQRPPPPRPDGNHDPRRTSGQ